MAITNASRVADFGSGIGTEGAVLQVDNTNKRIGIGTTNPQAMLQVGTAVTVYGNSGIVSATTFTGALTGDVTGNASGLSGSPDITINNLVGVAATFSGAADFNGAIDVDGHTELDDVNVSGAITATTFTGNLTGDVTGNASGLTNTPDITVGNITGVAATFSGVVTYEDVTNVDSVGIVTARGGFEIGAAGVGGTITSVGNAEFAGITTAGKGFRATTGGIDVASGISTFKGAHFDGGTLLKEKVEITNGKLSDNLNIDLEDGMVHHFTTPETTTSIPNIRVSGSVALNDMMATGETITLTVITTADAAGYSAQWTIDGSATTEEWNGGSAPSAGGASGKDFYTLNIIKTANAQFTVLANVSNFA